MAEFRACRSDCGRMLHLRARTFASLTCVQYVGHSNNICWSPISHWLYRILLGLCRILLVAKVVWNIRLKGDISCLLDNAWIFPRYINAIDGQGWVEQLPS
jgi:hypothetical protein